MTTTINTTINTLADLTNWYASVPTNFVTADVKHVVALNKVSLIAATQILYPRNITTDATRNIEFTAAAGASYLDDPGYLVKVLRYDPAYATIGCSAGGTVALQCEVPYTKFTRLQFVNLSAQTGAVTPLYIFAANCTVDQCFIDSTANNSAARGAFKMDSAGGKLSNSAIVQRATGDVAALIADIRSGVQIDNVTFAAVGGTKLTTGVSLAYTVGAWTKVAVMGVTAPHSSNLTPTATSCATDGTQTGWLTTPFSTANFVSVATDGTYDLRLVSGSALIVAGSHDIGVWEYQQPATPVSFSGPVPTRNGAVGSAASFANAGFFAGTATPFTYSLQAGTLPAGLTLNASTGIIGGTPTTVGTQSGIVVRATDTNNATADTNAYSIVIAASNAAPTFPGVISNITGTNNVAITPVNVSGQFSDTDALTYSASPAGTAWPNGLTINSSTGVISGTLATSTTTGMKVRATDTASQTVDSNSFSVTISAASGTITWPLPIAPINGDARLSAGHRIAVCNMTTDALVVKKTGLVAHSSTGVPPAISDALIVAGTQYRCHLILDSDNTASGTEVITAT